MRSTLTALLAVATSVGAALGAELTAQSLLPLADPHGGYLALIEPPADKLKPPTGKFLLFKGETLSLRLPVPEDGCYRIASRLVFGPWRDGRYGMFRAKADGVALEGYYHGWYGRGTTPAYRMQDKAWGVAFLRKPAVELSFHLEPKQAGDLLGIEIVRLERVADDPKAPRVPERPKAKDAWPLCVVDAQLPLDWVLPVPLDPRAFEPDGQLEDWGTVGLPFAIDARTIAARGYGAPPPDSNRDLSLYAGLAWDGAALRFAASVWDDERADTKPGDKWSGFWSHDGVVVLLHAADRDLTVGFNYYSPGCSPRPLPGGVRYAAKPREGGYDLEGDIPFAAIGLSPRVGDRLHFMLIAVDIDPSAPAGQRFQQYLWNTRMGDAPRWGEIRLVGPDGWGADLTPEREAAPLGRPLRYVGMADVFKADVTLRAIEVVEAASGAVVQRLPIDLKLAAGRRYRLRGSIPPPILAAGKIELRLVDREPQAKNAQEKARP